MKKIITSILLALLPVLASAYNAQIDGIYYNFSGNEGVVTYGNSFSNSYSGAVVIPNSVTYNGKTYSVTSIGRYAFQECSNLTSVTIPNSITSIGEQAFHHCTGLTSVTIPNSVTSIGERAFQSCSGLTSVTIPNNVTNIENEAFSYCSGLTSVTIPNGVTRIGDSAFTYCSGLTSITIPESVTSIGNSAFSYCSGLTSVTIPNSVSSIGERAFTSCSDLTSVTIGNSVTSIGKGNFSGCSGLTSITIPNSVTYIGENAFDGCSGLTSIKVASRNTRYDSRNNCNAIIETATNTLIAGCQSTTIPNSVTIIGEYAFCGHSGLTSIAIPECVINIGSYAFHSCYGLKSVTMSNSVTSIGDYAFFRCSSLTSITIPDNVMYVGGNAFERTAWYNNQPNGLVYVGKTAYKYKGSISEGEEVIIEEGTIAIAGYAFYNCSSLTSITIPNSVTNIGGSAFYNCTGLTSITIPNGVTSIGSQTFDNCSSLTSVTIGCGVTRIDWWAFRGCRNLISVLSKIQKPFEFGDRAFADISSACVLTVPIGTRNAYINNGWTTEVFKGGIIEEADTSPSIIFADANVKALCVANWDLDGNSELSEGEAAVVTSLGDVFKNKTNITSFEELQYFTGLTSIDNEAFQGCCNLTSIYIPNSVTSIGDYAFDGCSSLTSVTIPNSVTSIGICAFYNCTSLTSVAIGKNVTSIGWGTFQYMDGKNRNLSAKVYVNRGSDALLAVWNYAKSEDGYRILPYETGTSQILYPSYLSAVSKTQTTITYRINYAYSDLEYDCSANGNSLGNDEYIITGLRPDYKQAMSLTVRSANCTFSNRIKEGIKTLSLNPTISNEGVTASSISLKGSYTEGDANVISHSVVIDESEMAWDEGTLYGLDPNTLHNCKYIVVVEYGDGSTYSYEASKKITTAELSLTALQPRVISEGNVILAAQTSLGDEETNAGFEWRRIDWTEEFDSKFGAAIVYDGMMEGYIRSINSNYLWKFRPYYTSNAGNTYYGEWKGLDPSDYSYFEPTVRTSATVNVNGNGAEVKGYVMRGTDNVTSQGFMYWENVSPSSRRSANGIPADAVTVTANGNVMKAKFEGLDYETQYCYVAFATTSEGETFYGEEQTFTTDASPYTIGDLNYDNKVDIADAVTELNIMASGEYNKVADLNGDNKNDIADFVTVLNIMAGQGGEGPGPIVGTWEWREGDTYIRVTLNENGTYTVTGFVDGGIFNGSGNYTYSDGYLILTNVDMGADKIKVVSLTSTTLVLQNFPNEGNCTFYRK